MGLAPRIVQSIFQTLAMLNRQEGLSILVAEQNSRVALRIAHRATILENGIAALDGDTKSLRERADIKALYLGQAMPDAA
jgi:branched-chain amino acid transport system ATP-binding protein